MKAWYNGEVVDWDAVRISPLSHGFSRGAAVFDVTDVVSTEDGPCFVGLPEHVDRLLQSCRLVYLDSGLTREELVEAHRRMAAENRVTNGAAKCFVYYGVASFAIMPPEGHRADCVLYCGNYTDLGVAPKPIIDPVTACISRHRKTHPECISPQVKASGLYLNAFIAKNEVMARGGQEVIQLDTMGYVAEGATSNLFMVKDGTLYSPGTRSSLNGVTRRMLLQFLPTQGFPVEVTDLTAEDLLAADEIFLCGTVSKFIPFSSVDGRSLGTTPGPVTRAVADALWNALAKATPDIRPWLTPVS